MRGFIFLYIKTVRYATDMLLTITVACKADFCIHYYKYYNTVEIAVSYTHLDVYKRQDHRRNTETYGRT